MFKELVKIPRLSHCKNCNKTLEKDEKHTHGGKSYCKECYDSILVEKEAYNLLIKTTCDYYNVVAPTGLILRQIKEYKEKFNYTYNGMIYCLWYIKEIEKKPFSDVKYGIAYVKYYYDKAKSYYEQQSKISQSMNLEKPIEVIKTIKMKTTTPNTKGSKYLFNINSLFQESE